VRMLGRIHRAAGIFRTCLRRAVLTNSAAPYRMPLAAGNASDLKLVSESHSRGRDDGGPLPAIRLRS
jgi:hypothetical protein